MAGTILTIRSGASAIPEDSFLMELTALVSSQGVLDLTGDFLVEQQTLPDMTLQVSEGRAIIKGASGNAYPVAMDDDSQNVTITANASGNGRIDAVVLYIDKSASPDATASNVAKLIVVAGTAAGSPVAPTDNDIATELGAANPFLRLANITVDSGATEIVTADIADTRVRINFISGRYETPNSYAPAGAGTTTIDLSKGKKHIVTMPANTQTLAIANGSIGQYFEVDINNVTSQGALTWFSTIRWDGGTAPTLTGTNGKRDCFGFCVTGTGTYDGFVIGQNL